MTRRPDLTMVLAVVLPLLTVTMLALTQPDTGRPVDERPPTESSLQSATLVCTGGGRPLLSTASGARGKVEVRQAGDDVEPEAARLATDRLTRPPRSRRPLVVRASGDLAPALTGTVIGDPAAAGRCREPMSDIWFTGVGAAARHSSVVELVNPDAGPAVVDLTVLGREGPVEAPALRGVAVPARGVVRLDLARTVPRREELALHVVTTRGRVAASVRDRYDQLGAGASAEDWLEAQTEPTRHNTLLGMPPGRGQRMLTVANPGESHARATVQLVTPESTFTPEGMDELVVPPGGTTQVFLSDVLTRRDFEDAIGLRVVSEQPLTATVRSFVNGDLSHAVAGEPVEAGAVPVPDGPKRLLLAGAEDTGTVLVVARDSSGNRVRRQRVDVVPEQGAVVRLPDRAALVDVTAQGTAVVGAVLVATRRGAAVVPITGLVTTAWLADVQPGLR